MNKNLTLGSLFDGSGGFPLGGLLCGITPVWASEIEPFPIRVTTKRLPFMKHYGDVSKINGGEIEPVDIITFGSPCTDMSVAGKRAGLEGQQSVLFYQAIRIIKEMRNATNDRYPGYIVWENVPGAFSSNKGEDFRSVLEAVCSIKDTDAHVPEPPKGKWQCAGNIVGDGYSVAWRVLDAQYWGVPQRRRRIYLVADLTSEHAGKVLFEREGVLGNITQGECPWKETAVDAENSTGTPDTINNRTASTLYAAYGTKWNGNGGAYSGGNFVYDRPYVLNDQGGQRMDVSADKTATLRAEAHHPPCVMQSGGFCTEHSAKARSIGYEAEMSPTLRAGVVPATVYENHGQDTRFREVGDVAPTISSTYGTGGNNQPLVLDTPKTLKIRSGCEGGGKGVLIQEDKSATLACNNGQTVFVPTAYGICSDKSNSMLSANPHSGIYEAGTSRTIDANGGNPACNQGGIAIVEPVAFTQNQRDEVRIPGKKSGALCKAATKQQTYVLQGSMIGREEKNGPQGDGINEDVSFTLNTVDHHAVAYGIDRAAFNQGQNAKYDFAVEKEIEPTMVAKGPGAVAHPTYSSSKASFFTNAEKELVNTLMATDYKDPPLINDTDVEMGYIVRRLTPTECARLQGFPDSWCEGLGTDEPTEEEIAFWTEVWETHHSIVGTSEKPKSRKQIIKWLRNPHSDAAEYKMWGNGVALPCIYFVLNGIVLLTQNKGK